MGVSHWLYLLSYHTCDNLLCLGSATGAGPMAPWKIAIFLSHSEESQMSKERQSGLSAWKSNIEVLCKGEEYCLLIHVVCHSLSL
jgi:hypothetical protein